MKSFQAVAAIRNLCVKENYYTVGTVAEYENLLEMCGKQDLTKEDVLAIAEDIIIHSELPNADDYYEAGTDCYKIEQACLKIFEIA